MEDLAVFTAINHSGSFGKNFVNFKNNKYVIYWLRVYTASGSIFKTSVTVFHLTDRPLYRLSSIQSSHS